MYENLSLSELNAAINAAKQAQAAIDRRAAETVTAATLPELLQARAVLLEAEAQRKISEIRASAETVARAQQAVDAWRGELFELLEVGPVPKPAPREAALLGMTIDAPDMQKRGHFLDQLRAHCEQLSEIMLPVVALHQVHQIDLGFTLGQVPERWRRYTGDLLSDWLS